MSLITNADSKVTPAMEKAAERKERRQDYIDEKVAKAKKAEREQGHGAPDVRFAWQRDAYTDDSELDASREAIDNRTSLPVKEYVISESGDLEVVLGDAALHAVKEGWFCYKCGERQPEDLAGRDAAWKRRELHLGPAPDGCSPDRNCCYCLAELRPRGDSGPNIDNGSFITPEQLKLAMMAGVPLE